MDEDIIEDIADAFNEQLLSLSHHPVSIAGHYECAILDDVILMAIVINRHQPTYDLRYFYKRAGYPEPYPVHPMT